MTPALQLELDIRATLRSGKRSFDLHIVCESGSQRIVFYGPSGAGKSLTLKAIAGLVKPDSGLIRLNGRTLFDSSQKINLAPQARNVAYLFQDYALFPHLTVRQNVAFGLARGCFNPRRDVHDARVEKWLDAFHLQELAQQMPSELSGGQRQRTALARALVADPAALLLDEPFSALDAALRVKMRTELDQLQRVLGVPMILITHDPDDARMLGEHVLLLRDGRIDNTEQGVGQYGSTG